MFTVIVSQLTEMKGNLKQWLPKEKTSETTVLKYGKLSTSLNINCFYVLPDFLPWSRWNVIFKQLKMTKTTWFSLTCTAGGSDLFQVSVTRSESCMCSPSVCLPCRSEAPPAEHRLWQLPGERGFSPHCVRHRRQAEGEDGGGVSPHEEPVLRAAGQLHGLHHVRQKL